MQTRTIFQYEKRLLGIFDDEEMGRLEQVAGLVKEKYESFIAGVKNAT